MRVWSRLRSIKTWLVIFFFALTFVLGNIFFLKPWSNANTESSEQSIRTNEFQNSDNDGSKTSERRYENLDTTSLVTERKKYGEGNINSDVKTVKAWPKNIQAKHDRHTTKANAASIESDFKYKIAVLVIACNRPTVSRCLDQIIKYKPRNVDIPIIVSQDCGDKATEDVIKSYDHQVKLFKQPDLSDVKDVPDNMGHFMGYYKISRHYKWAITQAFQERNIDSVIIIEDDLDIAPDFFEYFLATRPLLDWDKSLWCVSAWNDNGKEGFVRDKDLLYRTDFFPGLGWMITRELWDELKLKWPKGFWDDWMRNPSQRRGRACIRPEISRSKTFGRVGVSQGQFFDQYLKFIKLNEEFYPFRQTNLKYLLKANYDKNFVQDVYSKQLASIEDAMSGTFAGEAARIQYASDAELETLTRQFDLMTDLKAGVARTAYKGIISFIRNGKRIYLTPYSGWTGYNET